MSASLVHKRVQEFLDAGDLDRAYRLVDHQLKTDPNDPNWLIPMSHILLKSEKFTLAYECSKRATELAPDKFSTWLNLGMSARELWRFKEARRAYNKGLKLCDSPEASSMFHVNLGSLCIDMGDYEGGQEHSEKALELTPDSPKAKANLGFSKLGQGEDGWADYRHCVGTEWRPIMQYNHEPMWDGKAKGTICIYGEQGLGDMVCFGVFIKPMMEWCKANDSKLIVESDPRLANAYRRSFPGLEVYGTLARPKSWNTKQVDYSLPIGQLGEYFPIDKTPWLVPDEDRVLQWRTLFKSKGKPAIGIAWTGGIPKTGSHFRRIGIPQLEPLFDSIDAHWVSLQYKPAGDCKPVVEYDYATLSDDYDNTIAMIAALDAVVGVPTTALHVAGCLGVRTIAMDAPVRCWKFASGVPFHPITQIPFNENWDQTIKDTASHLEDLCLGSSSDSITDSPSRSTSASSP